MSEPSPQRALTVLVVGVAIAIGRIVVGCVSLPLPIPRIDVSPSALLPLTSPGEP